MSQIDRKYAVWVNGVICNGVNAYRAIVQGKTLIISPHVPLVPTQKSYVTIIYVYKRQPFHEVFEVTDAISHFELLHPPDQF